MKVLIPVFAFLGLLIVYSVQGQTNKTFPASWSGSWEGDLEISNATGVVQRVPMALELFPTENDSVYTWNIIYGPDREAGKRAYLLKAVDREKGIYVVDEQNTIALESYLFGNRFYCWYLVAGNYILVIYEKRGEELQFDIVAGKEEPVSITGSAKYEGEDIPEVNTYPVTTVQRAVLKRKEN